MRVVVFALIIERRILGVMCARFHERILFVGVLCATSWMPRFLSGARSVRSEIPAAKLQQKKDIRKKRMPLGNKRQYFGNRCEKLRQ
jgi:hypothetical protein